MNSVLDRENTYNVGAGRGVYGNVLSWDQCTCEAWTLAVLVVGDAGYFMSILLSLVPA